MKTLLAIDVGNTHAHWGLVRLSDLKILRAGECATARLPREKLPFARAQGAAFCSVVPQSVPGLERRLAREKLPFARLTERSFPLPIRYDTPHTLGHDRLALALGAFALGHPRAVVVDIGTAVTVDAADEKRGFLGGFIVPGLGLTLESLHAHTAQLPHVHPQDIPEGPLSIGRNTAQAIGHGCALAFAGGLDRLVAALLRQFQGRSPRVLVSGKGERFFPKNKPHLCVQHLSLLGLAHFARQHPLAPASDAA